MGLKIGILGTRGIPNQYGGFEQVAEYLSAGLVARGNEVIVYNSHNHPHQQKSWNNVPVIHCYDPEYMIGTAGQFIYDLNCILDSRKRKFDIMLMLGYTSSSVWKLLYPSASIIISNMDGLEWKRHKYSLPVRKFLKYAEKLAVTLSHYHIADSSVIKDYLDNKYGINAKFIAYGADSNIVADESLLGDFGLTKQSYMVIMARMEPENNIDMILDGFCKTGSLKKMVVIGTIANRYGRYLSEKYHSDPRIVFTGALFNQVKVKSIIAFSSIYFHGHSVGGTNPSLLEAMAAKAFIAAHENPFNLSILGGDAVYFNSTADVASIINVYENSPVVDFVSNNIEKVLLHYNWDRIAGQYDLFFKECYEVSKAISFMPEPQIIDQLVEVE